MMKHIGCCRFVWNYLLNEQRQKKEEKYVSKNLMSKTLTKLKEKNEYSWLSEISAFSLKRICRDLEFAYVSFFKKNNGFPKFKTKKMSKQSFPVRTERLYFSKEKEVYLEKIGKVKCCTDFIFPIGRNKQKFYGGQVYLKRNKWLLRLSIEHENQMRKLTKHSMGIDLGIKELAVVEFNGQCKVFHNINKSKKMKKLNKKLKYYQRKQHRQYRNNPKNKSKKDCKWEKSKNIVKTEDKIKRIYAKIADIRRNYIHQTTHTLIEMLPCRIVMEDLKVQNMMKNKHLSRAIGEMCWYEFIRQMKYKSEWNGIEFIQVDRFYPSSKTCSCCGNIKRNLKLSDRIYICDICGLTIDRDYNAAINLSKYVVQ